MINARSQSICQVGNIADLKCKNSKYGKLAYSSRIETHILNHSAIIYFEEPITESTTITSIIHEKFE